MNDPVLFLLGAVALSALGGLIVWILSRPKREKFGSTIDTFTRDLDALAPPGQRSRRQPPRSPRQRQANGPRPTKVASSPRPGAATRPRPGPRPQPKK